jgi:hypothetical protein
MGRRITNLRPRFALFTRLGSTSLDSNLLRQRVWELKASLETVHSRLEAFHLPFIHKGFSF